MRGAVRVLGALTVLLSLAACRALPEMDLNPLIRVEHTPDGAVEIEALGPLIDIRDGPEGLSHAFRPFYQHKANFGYPVTDWLAPFGRHWHVEDGTRWRFWPLIWSGQTARDEDGGRWNGVFFPFIFAGNGPREGDGYFAFWPLGGRMRNLFGLEQYDFFLWPLFMRTKLDITEQSTSWTVFLLGGWTTGGPRDGSWRFLPFYRHRIVRHADGTLRTDQRSVLWPFFTWGMDNGDTRDPSYRYAFWPLVGYESAENWSRTTLLWPFFRFNREKGEGGQFLYDVPWPIFRWQKGQRRRVSPDQTHEVFRIFPLYSRQRTETLDSRNVLLLFWRRHEDGRTLEEGYPPRPYRRTDNWLIPLWHNSHRTVEGREGADTQLQMWPFYHSELGARGRTDRALFSLMPLRHWEFMRPADELYSFLWTVWRHRSDGIRDEHRFLFDTVLHRTSPEGVRISVPFLYSRVPRGAGAHRHRILWGLFGAGTDPDGVTDVSLLGLTLWRR